MKQHPPRWGNLVGHGDHDFIAFGLLIDAGLFVEGFYHGVQSIEKYLKALALTIYDPSQLKSNEEWVKWLKKYSHNLEKLGNFCGSKFPYFTETKINDSLKRFSEFDQATRYPWVEKTLGNGFSGRDIPIFFDIIKNARNSLPIIIDDYPLGIYVRGHHYENVNYKINGPIADPIINSVKKIRRIFPEIDKLVRIKNA
jgi:hypothetical protein